MNTIPETDSSAADGRRVLRWAAFFAVAYIVQGFAQTATLLYQPISYYFKTAEGYGAKDLSGVDFVLTFPWYLKPLYGLLSDFFPILGSRRKSYLLILSILTVGAFLLVTGVTDPVAVTWLLVLTSAGTAMADVMVDALMVEHGQALGKVRFFQGVQWTAIGVAGFAAAWGGGMIVEAAKGVVTETGDPGQAILAVHWAAMIAAAGPLLLLVGTWFMVYEPRHKLDPQGLRDTLAGAREASRSLPLWGAAVFICFFWFQPGFTSPMYLHITETLKISEADFGKAGAFGTAGYIAGALLFTAVLGQRFSIRQLAVMSILIYTVSTLLYLLLTPYPYFGTLVGLGLFYTFAWQVSTLTLLSLAAEVCPKRVEGFVFATLMALSNFSKKGSEVIGGMLYDDVFTGWMTPLLLISAAVTLVTLLFLPMLPKRQRDVATAIEPAP